MSGKLSGYMHTCSVCGRLRMQRRDCRSCLNGHGKGVRDTSVASAERAALLELGPDAERILEDEGLAEDLETLGYARPRW